MSDVLWCADAAHRSGRGTGALEIHMDFEGRGANAAEDRSPTLFMRDVIHPPAVDGKHLRGALRQVCAERRILQCEHNKDRLDRRWRRRGTVVGKLVGQGRVSVHGSRQHDRQFHGTGTPSTGQAGLRTITSSFRENIFRVGLNYKFSG